MAKYKIIFIPIFLSAFIVSCSNPTDEVSPIETVTSNDAPNEVVQTVNVNIKDNIDNSVYEPYEAVNSPKAIEQFGSRIDDVQALREQFAESAINSGECEKVTASEVKLDSDLNNLEFFIFCLKDGQSERQIYSRESDIKSAAL